MWYHFAKLLRHLIHVPKFTDFISPSKPLTIHESILFTLGIPVLVTGVLAWIFQFDFYFVSKILANLTANWKTRGPNKPDNKLINTNITENGLYEFERHLCYHVYIRTYTIGKGMDPFIIPAMGDIASLEVPVF